MFAFVLFFSFIYYYMVFWRISQLFEAFFGSLYKTLPEFSNQFHSPMCFKKYDFPCCCFFLVMQLYEEWNKWTLTSWSCFAIILTKFLWNNDLQLFLYVTWNYQLWQNCARSELPFETTKFVQKTYQIRYRFWFKVVQWWKWHLSYLSDFKT